jgi:2-methylcitrate dehydratase PrpD
MFPDVLVADDAVELFLPAAPLQLRQLKFKPYCCCAATHAYIEAMAQVGSRAAHIEAVDARIQTMTDSIVGNRNAHIYRPRNIEELQYSLPVQMALSALGMGNGYKTHMAYLRGNLDLSPDSDVIEFASRIRLQVSHELDRRYPRNFVADVTVRYRDGTSEDIFLERVKGTPANPFTLAEHQAKLDELTEEVIGSRQAGELFAVVDQLDPATPVSELTKLLQAPRES